MSPADCRGSEALIQSMEAHKAPVLIVGLGNVLLKDEGIGIHLLNALKKRAFDEQIFEFLDAGTMGLGLIDEIKDRRKVFIIDAVDLHEKPGTLFNFDYSALRNHIPETRLSLHQLDFVESVKIARFFDYELPELQIIGIQIKDIETGLELSEELQSRFNETVDMITHMITSDHSHHGFCRVECS
jgi:hydrogenase maturation protease